MSGFERRSFGLAFSLALAEITQRRIPLVIDTPLGNADSAYRLRTLKALTGFDADQIIILTHDREVTDDLLRGIEREVGQKFPRRFRPQDEGVAGAAQPIFRGVAMTLDFKETVFKGLFRPTETAFAVEETLRTKFGFGSRYEAAQLMLGRSLAKPGTGPAVLGSGATYAKPLPGEQLFSGDLDLWISLFVLDGELGADASVDDFARGWKHTGTVARCCCAKTSNKARAIRRGLRRYWRTTCPRPMAAAPRPAKRAREASQVNSG